MNGRITGISGPSVSVDIKGLRLYDMVYAGSSMLTGEVVRVEKDGAVIQVYEDTKGVGINEPVKSAGKPLAVRLGPGLLTNIFDGLQRPLERLKEEMGVFISGGREIYALDYLKRWRFYPLKRQGDAVAKGDYIGYFMEGAFKHYISSGEETGRIFRIADEEICLSDPIIQFEDGKELFGCHEWPVRAPRKYKRKLSTSEPLITGQRSIDFLFPFARGGTAILPGGFGTGKTILEQSIAKFADIDIVVYVGCGERGNEMAELIGEFSEIKDRKTGRSLMERTIMVVNTSNMPVAAREASIYTAVAMAEYYRDMGCHVLLLADSISRWAEALREISSALEEMPGEEGYPTYLASKLSNFFERAGVVETPGGSIGSLSMVLSVSPPGGDFTEPVTQACLRAAGAFIMLDTGLANRRHFPAVNWFQSYSLYERELSEYFREKVSPEWEEYRKRCREILHREEMLREVSEIVGIEGLQDNDRLLMKTAGMIRMEFLCQNAYSEDAFSSPADTISGIRKILEFHDTGVGHLKEGISIEEIMGKKGI